MEEQPLYRAKQRVEGKESVREIEALPDPRPQQNTAEYLGAIGKPGPQTQLIALQRPASRSILRWLEALRQMLDARVVQDPSRLWTSGLQLHCRAEAIECKQCELLGKLERRSHLRQDAALARLIGQSRSLLVREAMPYGGNVHQRLEAKPPVERAMHAEIEECAIEREDGKGDLSESNLFVRTGLGQRIARHMWIAKEPPVQIDLEVIAIRAVGIGLAVLAPGAPAARCERRRRIAAAKALGEQDVVRCLLHAG